KVLAAPSALRAVVRLAVLLTAALSVFAAPAFAQDGGEQVVRGLALRGAEYVDAASLAAALGDVVTAGGDSLTWRGAEGVATFFAGSADALLQRPGDGGADDWALSA